MSTRPRATLIVKSGEGKFIEWNVLDSAAKIPHDILSREQVTLEFVFGSNFSQDTVNFRFSIKSLSNQIILSSVNAAEIKKGINRILWKCELPVKAGKYKIFAEAYSITEQVFLDFWECKPDLTVMSDVSVTNEESESMINIPTSFSVVHG